MGIKKNLDKESRSLRSIYIKLQNAIQRQKSKQKESKQMEEVVLNQSINLTHFQ